ncbi:MAG: aldehyde dehydrogenase family protein [Lactobacillus sp.]|jgi:succinate-semialdehyde dehydrogenase/glutarate-semialdehyde dehydrogenase|nr:aldehyde dehydrogenase family protein [Lactobacillus sp.]
MAYQVVNPYTEKVIQTYPLASDTEVMEKLAVAADFYNRQKQVPVEERAAQLQLVAESLRANSAELAQTATLNMGKLPKEAKGEIELCAKLAQYYASTGASLLEPKPYIYGGSRQALLQQDAIGIVLSIEPWNFPYSQVMRVFAPNFLVGNPVVLKHASIVAGCAAHFEKVLLQAGIEPGAFQNLFVSYDQIANILTDKRVQGVALTGSEAVGRQIAALAGQNLVKSTMELGGNDVFAVLKDADIDLAVQDATAARLRNAGQVCTSAKRYIVQQDVAADFIAGIEATFQNQVLGDPLAATTTLAPLASKGASDQLQSQLDQALAHGARALVAGGQVAGLGNFFAPAILTDITPDNPAFYQEFFGPVAQVYVVPDDQALIKLANDSNFGLAGAVYSKDTTHAHEVASQLETGQVFINQPSGAYPELPFGGVKNSGYGREMSDLGLYEFTNQKIVVFK